MESATWSSVLVEELMETDVIDGRNMAILKEQVNSRFVNDPALLINLRHDKVVRSSLQLSKPLPRNSEVVAEAKRTIRQEDNDQKKAQIQDKIVEEEIRKFQNHIVNLRKMNRRLERLTYPSDIRSRKKMERVGSTIKANMFQAEDAIITEKLDGNGQTTEVSLKCNPLEEDMLNVTDLEKEEISTSLKRKPQSFPLKGQKQKERGSFTVCGSKLEGTEILQFHSDPCIQGPRGHQYSIFEQIGHKYNESERLHMLREKEDCFIRPSQNVARNRKETVITPLFTSTSKDNQVMTCKTEGISQGNQLSCMLPSNSYASRITVVHGSLERKAEHESIQMKSSKPEIISFTNERKREKIKLDAMTSSYTKWMKFVCEEDNAKSKQPILKEKKAKDKEFEVNDTKGHNREGKIEQVLQALQRNKEAKSNFPSNIACSHINQQFSRSVNDLLERKSNSEFRKSRRVVSGSYDHRLSAQKDIIVQQKAKLEEQRRQIDDLKMSQLKIETEKSRLQAQKTLNYVLQSCDEKAKIHARPLKSSFSFADVSPGNEFVERMEQRALEQRQKRLSSQERRKQFEEQWKLKIKEEEEKKRKNEEELTRKRNEELQEMRRMEREAREVARKERERMIVLEKKAYAHSCQQKLKHAFRGFKKLIVLRKQQAADAENFYSDHLMRVTLKAWKKHVDHSITAKMSVANEFYELTLMRHCFDNLMKEQELGTIRMQVAVDMYEFRLQDKAFHFWLQLTQDQHALYAEKVIKADVLRCKILLKRFFSLWLTLPKVAQQERERERRKTQLRRKVQQFLPDFRPTISSD